MSYHRLPLFAKPSRFGRLKAGFFTVDQAPAPPPEGLQIVSQWSMDDLSWADAVGQNDFISGSNPVDLLIGFQGSSAGFTSDFASMSAPVRTMNVADWEIEFYLYLDSFTPFAVTSVAGYGDLSGSEKEWFLYIDNPNVGEYLLRLESGLFSVFDLTVPIQLQTWHLVRVKFELGQDDVLVGPLVPSRFFLSVDGSVPVLSAIFGPPPVMSNPYTGALHLGNYNGFQSAAGMRIDEMVLRMEYFFVPPPPEPQPTSYWSMDTNAWVDAIEGHNFTASGSVSTASGFLSNAALFGPTGRLETPIPGFAHNAWEIELYLYFSDINAFPQDVYSSTILYATGAMNDIELAFDYIGQLSLSLGGGSAFISVAGISSATWHHIKFGYRNITGLNYLSVDGVETTGASLPESSPVPLTLSLGYRNEWNPALDGMRIDELRLKRVS
jgi:hypothetical protein